jgi:pimeloyl-ACP methyl ester carboxylesterase
VRALDLDSGDLHSTIQLRDGRQLGYVELGAPRGPVVIHCHGGGSSRLEALFLADAAAELGVRLIGIDRPGIGRSDPHAYASLTGWASDVAELADRLSIDRFAIQGMSKGGPYALACGFAFPDRVRACGLISTVPPTETLRLKGPKWLRLLWWLGGHWPGAFLTLAHGGFPGRRAPVLDAQKQIEAALRWMARADREVLATNTVRSLIGRVLAEHYRHGGIGARYDARLSMRAWGFDLRRLPVQRLFLWHGREDRLIGCAIAEALAAAMPGCTSTFYPRDGHFSVLINHAMEILARMR